MQCREKEKKLRSTVSVYPQKNL